MRFLKKICGPALVLCAMGLSSATAEFRWEETRQEFEASPEDRQVETTFKFANAGAKPIEIKEIRSCCGCTSGFAEKRVYGPGEKGEIKAKFVFGARMGPQKKILTIRTDDGATQDLELTGSIREPLTVTPRLFVWRVGESAEKKVVPLKLSPTSKRKILSVSSSNRRISAKLERGSSGEAPSLTIAPENTERTESAEVTIVTGDATGKTWDCKLLVRIR